MSRLHGLDALRGVAALLVLSFHAREVVRINPHGYLAVDLFFVLSGFVLSHAYGAKLREGMGMGRFAVLRMIRLYPLYLAGACFGLWLDGGTLPTFVGIPALASPHDLYPGNNPLWSLVAEVLASLAFVRLVRWRSPLLIGAAVALGLLFLKVMLVAGHANLGSNWPTAIAILPRTGFSFIVGILLYRLFQRRGKERPPSVMSWTLPLLFAGLTFLPDDMPLVDIVVVFAVIPALVYAGATYPVAFPRVAVWLGLVSYPVYASHAPLLHVASGMPIVPVMAGIIALSYALARYYDEPLRKWLMAFHVKPVSAPARSIS